MLDDAALRRRGVLACASHGPALRPVFGIVERSVITGHTQHGGGHADGNARFIHHVEHAAQAFVRLADEVADGATRAAHRVLAFAEVQQRVRDAAVAELVVQARQRHVVALAGQLAVGADEFFRHDEERDTFRARDRFPIRPGDLREHEVDDVLGQLLVAVRDPHLVAAQAVTWPERVALETFTVGRGTRHHIRQTGAGLRLAQAHRAGEAAGEFLLREHLLLQRRAVHHQQVGVAAGQHAAATDADAGLREETVGRHLDNTRQLHATDLVVLRSGEHARLGIGFRGRDAAFGQVHLLAVEPRLFGVGLAVEGCEFFARDLFAGVHHRSKGLARMVGEARALLQCFDTEPVVEQKVGGLAVAHACSLVGGSGR